MPQVYIDTAAQGDTVLVPAGVITDIIQVLGLDISSAGRVVVSLTSNSVLPIFKTYATIVPGGALVLPESPTRGMYCLPGHGLVLNLSAPVGVCGVLSYAIATGPTVPVSLRFNDPKNSMYAAGLN